jgi:hypothetical protein
MARGALSRGGAHEPDRSDREGAPARVQKAAAVLALSKPIVPAHDVRTPWRTLGTLLVSVVFATVVGLWLVNHKVREHRRMHPVAPATPTAQGGAKGEMHPPAPAAPVGTLSALWPFDQGVALWLSPAAAVVGTPNETAQDTQDTEDTYADDAEDAEDQGEDDVVSMKL